MKATNVFITGASGFIGSHLSRALLEAGAKVHAIRHRHSGTRIACEGIQWHDASLLDAAALRSAVLQAKPRVVFHLAAYGTIAPDRDRQQTYDVNITGTSNLWRALEDVDCRLVYAGTCGEYGVKNGPTTEDDSCEPTTFYSATKHAAGTMLKALGLETGREVVVLRPFGPYGEGDDPSRVIPNVIGALIRGEKVPVTAGEQVRDFAHVDDQVRAFILAATRPLPNPIATYNVGSGRCIQLKELFDKLTDAVGGNARSLVSVELPYRESEVWSVCADISAARRDLGYEPGVSLDAGIARTVEWYRRQCAAQ